MITLYDILRYRKDPDGYTELRKVIVNNFKKRIVDWGNKYKKTLQSTKSDLNTQDVDDLFQIAEIGIDRCIKRTRTNPFNEKEFFAFTSKTIERDIRRFINNYYKIDSYGTDCGSIGQSTYSENTTMLSSSGYKSTFFNSLSIVDTLPTTSSLEETYSPEEIVTNSMFFTKKTCEEKMQKLKLTKREVEFVKYLLNGKTKKQCAIEMGVSNKCIDYFELNIKRKIGRQ
jgi:hypothetical protein